MARKSRVNTAPPQAKKKDLTDIFNVAIYIRLSVENNGKEDADSLENQRTYLAEYIAKHPEFVVVDEYIDNGYSGTNFERPSFERMMTDITSGKVDCVIVKDFSRLGRNFAETGNYIERVFPFLGVRFISVNDNYDSASANDNEEFVARIKNLVNEVYAKDISKKLCSTMKSKRVRGEYIGNYAPYGYLKDPSNHNHLIVDPEIAPVVLLIFQLRADGMGMSAICNYLNDRDYPSPGRLRFERGIITNNNKKGSELPWHRRVLKDILLNVVYIGHLAQGRSAQCLYKGESFHWTDPAEWDYVQNTHEPIIPLELWEKVQSVNVQAAENYSKNNKKYAHIPKRPNPYGSILVCADCGRVMKYVRSYSRPKKNGEMRDYYNYKCPNNIDHGELVCGKKSIRADDLDTIILTLIKKQMDVFLDVETTLKKLIAIEKRRKAEQKPARLQKEVRAEIESVKKLLTALYTDFKDRLLTEDEYIFGRQEYLTKIDSLEKELSGLKERGSKPQKLSETKMHWQYAISKYYDSNTLAPELLAHTVKSIRFRSADDIEIEFNYVEELLELQSECERIREEVA